MHYIVVASVYCILGSILYMVERHTSLRVALNVSVGIDIFTQDPQDHLVQTSHLVDDITGNQRNKMIW